jgi:ubiquinone/menaquinone biosynthesis C-methylase UbiE
VGTGTGVALEALAAAVGAEGVAVGVDLSAGMLRTGHAARPSLKFVAADVVDLPFRDGTFDVVTGNFVIHLVPNHETALFDMIRVLRRGGLLALSAWASHIDDEFSKTWRELTEAAVGQEMLDDVGTQAAPGRERFSDRKRFEETLRDAGLHPVRIEVREYHVQFPREDWLAAEAVTSTGRFLRQMLGEEGWKSFMDRARAVFAERFPEQLNDFRDVLLAMGTKPG